MSSYGKYLDLTRRKTTPRGVKAERMHHVISYNPVTWVSGQPLLVRIPKLAANDLIVPLSLYLTFDLNITGSADAWFINNISANLIDRLVVKWGGKVLLDIDKYYILQTYKDLWLTTFQRENSIRHGISTLNIRKLRASATSAVATNTIENSVNRIFGKKFVIPLRFSAFTDHHPFYPYIYREEIEFYIYFAKASTVIAQTAGPITADYNIANISFEYDTVYEPYLADQIRYMSDSPGGISYMYEYVTYIPNNPIDQSLTSFTLDIKHPRKSIKGILMLFELQSVANAATGRDPEYFFNPQITSISITLDGKANRIFEQPYLEYQQYDEAQKKFLTESNKEHENVDTHLLNFVGSLVTADASRYCLWIDTRSTEDNNLFGSGFKLISSNNGFLITLTKNNTVAGLMNIHTYLVADAQFTLINRLATDPEFE